MFGAVFEMAELERKLGFGGGHRANRITGQMLVRPYKAPEDAASAKGERYYQAPKIDPAGLGFLLFFSLLSLVPKLPS